MNDALVVPETICTREEDIPMSAYKVVVVGFSAGGVEALARLVAELPADLPAALLVAHHFPAESVSALPNILRRVGRLPAAHPVDGQQIEPGRIYVARPDQHLLVKGDRLRLTRGPRENRHRPSVDALFRTAGRSWGPRAIGVLLSGSLDDGTAGLFVLKSCGGTAVVQDPAEALYPGMPENAIRQVGAHHVVPISAMAPLLVRLVHEPIEPTMKHQYPTPGPEPATPDPAEFGSAALEDDSLTGPPSALTCPDCGGALWERQNGEVVRYRCHVGHAYTAEGLVAVQNEGLEGALWSALRALQEKAELSRRMGARSRQRGLLRSASQFEAAAAEAEEGSRAIRHLLLDGSGHSPDIEAHETMGGRAAKTPSGT